MQTEFYGQLILELLCSNGRTFTIDERQGQDILGYYSVRYKASFSCKLYDGSGNTIDLTNGVIVGSFENI
ncbi:MAG: hypothetical protein IPI62_14265 [Bacteroidetes bacterium]|nr:hypothetical protein [Bacteroidota bacterium]